MEREIKEQLQQLSEQHMSLVITELEETASRLEKLSTFGIDMICLNKVNRIFKALNKCRDALQAIEEEYELARFDY